MLALELAFYMILRGKILKDQLLFEAKIERVAKKKKKARQRQTRDKDTLESNLQPLFLFQVKFCKRKTTLQKSKHRLLGGHLEIMSCIKGQDIFLVLQYLLPPGP